MLKGGAPITNERIIQLYTKQILLGLEHLHQRGVIHRDIKPANILRDSKGLLKLADFGNSATLASLESSQETPQLVGTPNYMSPELAKGGQGTEKCDIWAVGCTVYEMVTGKPPWHDRNPVATIFAVVTKVLTVPENSVLSKDGVDFLKICLAKEPEDRSSATQLLSHPWIKALD